MENILQSTILGIAQGLTEFLPISSSAHLVIIPWFSGWAYQGLTYDVALHFGTLAGVLAYFKKDWTEIITCAFKRQKKEKSNMLWLLVVATIPGALAGLFLEHYAETLFRKPQVIACTLILFGLFLYFADKKCKTDAGKLFNLKTALIIGLFQGLAIVPGVSRSGITMTAGLLVGFARSQSVRISFLMSAPIILGASIFELKNLADLQINAAFFSGFLAAAISGWLAVKFLMNFVRKHPFNIFVLYRLILGGGMLAYLFLR
jgi:undecaprenyl-diphosphatase